MVCACKRVYISAEFKNLCFHIGRFNPMGNFFSHYYLIYVTSMLVCTQPCALVYTSTETNAQIVCLFFHFIYFFILFWFPTYFSGCSTGLCHFNYVWKRVFVNGHGWSLNTRPLSLAFAFFFSLLLWRWVMFKLRTDVWVQEVSALTGQGEGRTTYQHVLQQVQTQVIHLHFVIFYKRHWKKSSHHCKIKSKGDAMSHANISDSLYLGAVML